MAPGQAWCRWWQPYRGHSHPWGARNPVPGNAHLFAVAKLEKTDFERFDRNDPPGIRESGGILEAAQAADGGQSEAPQGR